MAGSMLQSAIEERFDAVAIGIPLRSKSAGVAVKTCPSKSTTVAKTELVLIEPAVRLPVEILLTLNVEAVISIKKYLDGVRLV
jgi:hypothetical protein